MTLRKPLLCFGVATVIALLICQFSTPISYGDQLILVQTKEELGHIDKRILREPIEVQAVLLDYADDKELVLKAWVALSKYPENARKILLLYGAEPEFKDILKSYGDGVFPPVQYFLENDVLSVKAMDYSSRAIQSLTESAKALADSIAGQQPAKPHETPPAQPATLGPKERGWYAVNYIASEGYKFLGQFAVDKDLNVKWNQTDRILQGLTSFFAGGIRTLETKYDVGGDVAASDYFWAGVDAALVVAPLKLLRAGKAVESGKTLSVPARTRLFAPRLVSKARIFEKLGKYGAIAATAYIVIAHPRLINSLLAEFANLMGWNPWLVQFAGWALIITLALYPFSWLLAALARVVLFGLSWIERPLRKSIPKVKQAVA